MRRRYVDWSLSLSLFCILYLHGTLADHGWFVDRGKNKIALTENIVFFEHIKYDTTVEIEQNTCTIAGRYRPVGGKRNRYTVDSTTQYGTVIAV